MLLETRSLMSPCCAPAGGPGGHLLVPSKVAAENSSPWPALTEDVSAPVCSDTGARGTGLAVHVPPHGLHWLQAAGMWLVPPWVCCSNSSSELRGMVAQSWAPSMGGCTSPAGHQDMRGQGQRKILHWKNVMQTNFESPTTSCELCPLLNMWLVNDYKI